MQLSVGGLGNTGAAQHEATSQGHEVTQNSRGGRGATGTGAVEHQLTGVLSLDEHGVERTVHAGQRVLARNQGRVHANVHTVFALALADSQQLDDVAVGVRCRDVIGGDGGNALGVHIVNREVRVERQRSNNGGLRSGVEALNVGGGVGLGVAQLLGVGQRIREGGAGGVHLIKNVVGGAVHDAQNAGHAVTGQGVAQRAQNRNRTGHGGLVGQLRAGCIGGGLQLHAVLGQQGLVARNDGLAGVQRAQDAGAGRLDAAGQLDHHVGGVNQGFGVGGVQRGVGVPVASCLSITHGNADQLDGRTNALLKDGVILYQDACRLGTDVTGTQQGNFDFVSHDSLFLRSFRGVPRGLFGLRCGALRGARTQHHFIKRRDEAIGLKLRLLFSEMRHPSQS